MSYEQGDTIHAVCMELEGKGSILKQVMQGFSRQHSDRRVISLQILHGTHDVLDNLSWTSGHALQQDNQQASPAPLKY
jgi:hypothetical protein